jgi:threonine aldolase
LSPLIFKIENLFCPNLQTKFEEQLTMGKYSFLDDYSEGCHPKILEVMVSTNLIQQTAYGNDEYSEQARKLIREHIGQPDIPVFLVGGGTLANIIIMSSALRSHEAVIADEYRAYRC